jgi:hypothetical protein
MDFQYYRNGLWRFSCAFKRVFVDLEWQARQSR